MNVSAASSMAKMGCHYGGMDDSWLDSDRHNCKRVVCGGLCGGVSNSACGRDLSMINVHGLRKKVELLNKYAVLEGTEYGEMCQALCLLAHYPDHMTEPFLEALVAEIERQLAHFQDHARIERKPDKEIRWVETLVWLTDED